jgi:hypothetical protein
MDFKEVTSIGQAFADEIFRVFRNSHPEIELYAINASVEVQDPINRAQSSGYQLQSMIMASGTNPTSDARPESGEDPIGDG